MSFGDSLSELIENVALNGEPAANTSEEDEAEAYIRGWFKDNGHSDLAENPDRKYDEFKEQCE
jgi:hypothetical protein